MSFTLAALVVRTDLPVRAGGNRAFSGGNNDKFPMTNDKGIPNDEKSSPPFVIRASSFVIGNFVILPGVNFSRYRSKELQ
jgi:hypothetical protein